MKIIQEKLGHKWRFARVGGIDRVLIDSGSDVMHLDELDQKLWTALSCPTHGLELDSKTLDLIDTDGDGRIKVNEVIAAIKWIGGLMKNPDDLLKSGNEFPLSAINTDLPEGKHLYESAKQILKNIGRPDDEVLTVEETSDTQLIFANTIFNGDGIIIPESAGEDIDLQNCINEIIQTNRKLLDRSGKDGINQEIIDTFFNDLKAYLTWIHLEEDDHSKFLPFGDKTADFVIVYNKVKTKIDDYFVRCKMAEFDSKSAEVFNMLLSRYESISAKNLSESLDEIATFPLAFVDSGKELPLTKEINPAWESDILNFKINIVDFLFKNKKSLSEAEWIQIKTLFVPYIEWMNIKPISNIEIIDLQRLKTILQGDFKQKLEELIHQDCDLKDEAEAISKVDQLVRYYRDLYVLLRNFVSFVDFYSPKATAIFQAGTLYIDRRSCDLCIKVDDIAAHSKLAAQSGIYMMYCECRSKTKNEKMNIVAALTNGDIDNLEENRNAIFYDWEGNDWDATIVKIVENPVSIRQAFWSPYRRINKMISSQIEKFASDKNKNVHDTAAEKIENHPVKLETPEKIKPAEPFDIGKFVGIFAAIGLALGAIGSTLMAVFTGFFQLVWWKMPFAVLGLMLVISGPAMILAWLKLRKRNLAPLLNANGWAINAKANINIIFGRTLTHLAVLPLNSERNLKDPYSGKKFPYLQLIIAIIIIVVAIYYACNHGWVDCPIHWFIKH